MNDPGTPGNYVSAAALQRQLEMANKFDRVTDAMGRALNLCIYYRDYCHSMAASLGELHTIYEAMPPGIAKNELQATDNNVQYMLNHAEGEIRTCNFLLDVNEAAGFAERYKVEPALKRKVAQFPDLIDWMTITASSLKGIQDIAELPAIKTDAVQRAAYEQWATKANSVAALLTQEMDRLKGDIEFSVQEKPTLLL